MAVDIHVADTGTSFVMTLTNQDSEPIDLTTPDIVNVQFVFRKPDQSTITKTASFVTDGTDGKAKYITLSTDLDMPGTWHLQAFVNTTTGFWHSDITKFKVDANLK